MTADIRLVLRRFALKMLGVAPATQLQADGAPGGFICSCRHSADELRARVYNA